ncbi:hypothetical protein QMA09_12840 [Planococcus sp. APC 3906]|uniref:hypothetical protein n=1 Tax=Planococcus sp. APC 3906 TaxID=3035194 RepID=UPI0025B60B14|nr:hypothetical protein [Planococcus sp. APC 3906]MDN3451078.1 hypothetical protein [Planococcus sp. APC 3906]
MVDEELQKQITALVMEGKMETAERLLIDYVEQNPYDIEGWNRLIMLEALAPFEDYEQAADFAQDALYYHPTNLLYFILILSFTPWYRGELDDELVEQAEEVQHKADPEIASIISLLLADHYQSKDKAHYEFLLKRSIQDYPYIVRNYTDLGQHYMGYGKKELGKALVKKGFANVKFVYIEGVDNNHDDLDIIRYINEMITGVFTTEYSYRDLENLLQK